MRKFLPALLIVALFSSSCSVFVNDTCIGGEPIPGYVNSQQVKAGRFYDGSDTAVALDIFYDRWTHEYGQHDEVLDVLQNLCITWEPYPFVVAGLGTDEDGLPNRAAGLTDKEDEFQDPCTFRVYIGPKPDDPDKDRSIGRTAFFHEIVHIMLWVVDGYPYGDPDHEGDAYEGWTVEHNDLIRLMKTEAVEVGI